MSNPSVSARRDTAPEALSALQTWAGRIRANVARAIVGKDDVADLLLVTLLCEGHVLIEDIPGIGKTTLAKALAASLGCAFRRIQFTPDLLPSDVTGVSVWDARAAEFSFRPGPIFAQVILADEINRASPRTQSALLEAMQERQVTVDGVTRPLERPFMVLATQNPVELEGTFPLPEAQLDRFLLRVSLGYPDRDSEREILRRYGPASASVDPLTALTPVSDAGETLRHVAAVRGTHVSPPVESYLLSLAQATRDSADLVLGASPRATLALYQAGQALAALQGRGFVLPDDLQRLVGPAWAHRLLPVTRQRLHGADAAAILARIVEEVPVPVEESWSEAG